MVTYVENRFAEDQYSNHLMKNRSNVNHNSSPQPSNYYKDDHMNSIY